MNDASIKWDVFISHASEDKKHIARPIAIILQEVGLNVWIDESKLRMGTTLLKEIENAMHSSKYCVAILSSNFFLKEWTRRELNYFLKNEHEGNTQVLPVWHNVNQAFISKYSKVIANKTGINTSHGLLSVVSQILRVICPEKLENLRTLIVEGKQKNNFTGDPFQLKLYRKGPIPKIERFFFGFIGAILISLQSISNGDYERFKLIDSSAEKMGYLIGVITMFIFAGISAVFLNGGRLRSLFGGIFFTLILIAILIVCFYDGKI